MSTVLRLGDGAGLELQKSSSARVDTIYLDLDGVLVDWVGGVMDLAGVPWAVQPGMRMRCKGWNDISSLVRDGLVERFAVARRSVAEGGDPLWAVLNEEGQDWWASLKWLPSGEALFDALRKECADRNVNIVFVTSPSAHPSSAAGKQAWLSRNIRGTAPDGKPLHRCFAITPAKHYLASPSKVLVDDRPRNVERFMQVGGRAILYPQPWSFPDFSWEEIEAWREDVLTVLLEMITVG